MIVRRPAHLQLVKLSAAEQHRQEVLAVLAEISPEAHPPDPDVERKSWMLLAAVMCVETAGLTWLGLEFGGWKWAAIGFISSFVGAIVRACVILLAAMERWKDWRRAEALVQERRAVRLKSASLED